jgi:Lrp/AsnC family leucine-responsive transcriptional regulator
MEEHDLSVLDMLVKDSRVSLTEISRRTGLSRFAVKDRVEKLFNAGVILGPTIVVDPTHVGVSRTVFYELKTNPHEPWLAKMLERITSCDLLDGTVGEFSLLARFRLVGDEHFAAVLKKMDDAMGRSYFKKYRVVNAIRIFKESGVAFEIGTAKPQKVDEADREILRILLNQAQNAKSPLPFSTVELSKLLGGLGIRISQPAVFNRLSRLEKSGVILGYTLRVDHSKLGLQTKFIVRIKANPNAYDAVAGSYLTAMPQISDLYRTGEEYGLLATVRVRDASEFNAFLLRLYDSKEIIDTYSTLVLEERKASALPLGEEQD